MELAAAEIEPVVAPLLPDGSMAVLLRIQAAYIALLPDRASSQLHAVQQRGILTEHIDRAGEASAQAALDAAQVDAHLGLWPQYIAAQGQSLRGSWTSLGAAARALADQSRCHTTLERWVVSPPPWLASAPPEALEWLVEVALNVRSASWESLARRAVAEGTSAADYLSARLTAAGLESDPPSPTYVPGMVLRGDLEPEVLTNWTTASPREEVFRDELRCILAFEAGDYELAEAVGRSAFEDWQNHSAAIVALKAAGRSFFLQGFADRVGHLRECVDFASRVRDSMNRVGASTGAVAASAMRFSGLLGDLDTAYALAMLPPAGVATPLELEDARVAAEVEALRPQLAAGGFEVPAREGANGARSDEEWRRLLDAELGLSVDSAAVGSERLRALRARAATQPMFANALIFALLEEGQVAEAARAAADGARRWDDADLWVTAAQLFDRLDEHRTVIECAESALTSAIPGWPRASAAQLLIADAHFLLGNADKAHDAAVRVAAHCRWDHTSAWRVALRRMDLGDWVGAVEAIRRAEWPPQPHTAVEVVGAGYMFERFGTDFASFETMEQLLREWMGQSPVVEPLTRCILLASRVGLDEVTATRIDQLLQSIDLRPHLATELRDEAATEDSDRSWTRQLYSIKLLESFTEMPSFEIAGDDTRASAVVAGRRSVVLDLSAALALAFAPTHLSEKVMGTFRSLEVTAPQMLDVRAAEAMSDWSQRSHVRGAWAGSRDGIAGLRWVTSLVHSSQDQILAPESRDPYVFVRQSPLRVAALNGLALWCDDARMRVAANELGIDSFGTASVIRACVQVGSLAAQEAQEVLDALAARGFVFRDELGQ